MASVTIHVAKVPARNVVDGAFTILGYAMQFQIHESSTQPPQM
jgi:hypothetical protein